jgi:signal transduction histidine kinase
MLDDLLTLENIETGKIIPNYTLFRFGALVNKLLFTSKSLLKKGQQVSFESNTEEMIYHDAKIIQIILSNLLNNAIKYSEEGDKILIRTEQNGDHIEISVEDQGIGIPEAEQRLIFKRFFRASNVMYQPGTGIGLNIVKGYVQGLNGEIDFESREGEYTRFKVKLPNITNHE